MRALLKPRIQKPGADEYAVDMLARTGNDKIVVRGLNRGAFTTSVERWRLFSEADRHRRIGDDEFSRLPWNGKGSDPLTLSTTELFDDMEVLP